MTNRCPQTLLDYLKSISVSVSIDGEEYADPRGQSGSSEPEPPVYISQSDDLPDDYIFITPKTPATISTEVFYNNNMDDLKSGQDQIGNTCSCGLVTCNSKQRVVPHLIRGLEKCTNQFVFCFGVVHFIEGKFHVPADHLKKILNQKTFFLVISAREHIVVAVQSLNESGKSVRNIFDPFGSYNYISRGQLVLDFLPKSKVTKKSEKLKPLSLNWDTE